MAFCKKAFSLVEIIVTVSIIAVLTAIAFPVFLRARESANRAHCVSNLHQLDLDIELYRTDYDGQGVYGDIYAMGLPPRIAEGLGIKMGPGLQHLGICNGPGRPQGLVPWGFAYKYVPSAPGLLTGGYQWKNYVQSRQDNALLLFDPNHNDPEVPMHSSFTTKYGFGVRLNGSLVTKTKKGDIDDLSWWDDSPLDSK